METELITISKVPLQWVALTALTVVIEVSPWCVERDGSVCVCGGEVAGCWGVARNCFFVGVLYPGNI